VKHPHLGPMPLSTPFWRGRILLDKMPRRESWGGSTYIIMSKNTHRYKQISTLNNKTLMYVLKKLLKKIPFQRTKLFKNICLFVCLFQRIIQMFHLFGFLTNFNFEWMNEFCTIFIIKSWDGKFVTGYFEQSSKKNHPMIWISNKILI
jgi:hypothetical protein